MGHAVVHLIDAQCYKPEGRGSIPDEVIVIFNWPNPSSRYMALEFTQPLTEIIPVILLGVKGSLPGRKADNLTAICEPIV
jgi:hypothetical protein